MRLDIGSRSYDFRVTPGTLRSDAGRRTAVLCNHEQREILLSGEVPQPLRAQLAALAVSEAWQREMIQRPPIAFVGEVS